MAEVDRATIAAGIPGIILMENAAARVVEYIAAHFAPVSEQRIVVVCGKGNNGGDGLAIARQLHVRFAPRNLRVVLICDPAELAGDAAAQSRHAARRGHSGIPRLRPRDAIGDAASSTRFWAPV